MYAVAVANQKGGVGKTTSAANIADAAAERGARVLLVDLDPQGNATSLVDAQPRTYDGNAFGKPQVLTIADALYFTQEGPDAPVQTGTLEQVTVPAGEYWSAQLRVVPANQDLANRAGETWKGADGRLAAGLAGLADVDLVVIDCGPTVNQLMMAALLAADGVVIVSEPADHSLKGLPLTQQLLATARATRAGDEPALLGLVATNVPARESRAAENLEAMQADFHEQLWEVVPRRSIVRQAEGARAPVRAFGRDGRDVAAIYDRIAARVLEHAGVTTPTATTTTVTTTQGA